MVRIFAEKKPVDGQSTQDAAQGACNGQDQGLSAQTGQVFDNGRIASYGQSHQEEKDQDRGEDRLSDLFKGFRFAQKVAAEDASEHDGDNNQHGKRD